MKVAFKILRSVLVVLVLAILASLVAIQSPDIQGKIALKVLEAIQKNLDADISAQGVSIRPFEAVSLRNVVLLDKAPVVEGTDTIASIGILSAKFSVRNLLAGTGCAYLSRASLRDVTVNLAVEQNRSVPGKTYMNLERVLGIIPTYEQSPPPNWGNLLKAGRIELENVKLRYVSEVRANPQVEGVIDFEDLHVWLKRLMVRNLSLSDSHIRGCVDCLEAVETAAGLHIKDLSASHVNIGSEAVKLENLHLESGNTNLLMPRFRLIGPLDDYEDFVQKIRIQAEIRKGSVLTSSTLAYFAEGLDAMKLNLSLQGKINGYVNDFSLSDFSFKDSPSGVEARLSGDITGITDVGSCLFNLKIQKINFTLPGLGRFVCGVSPDSELDLSNLGSGERFCFKGGTSGPLNRLCVNGRLSGAGGKADIGITLRNTVDTVRALEVDGNLGIDEIDLGSILQTKDLGPLSLNTKLSASLPSTGGPDVVIDSLNISHLQALGYDYHGIKAKGTYSESAFEGYVGCTDPNCYLFFQGLFNFSPLNRNAQYKFYANLNANLHAMNIDPRSRSFVSFQAMADFRNPDQNKQAGVIQVKNLVFESETGRHDVGKIDVNAISANGKYRITLNSKFMEGSYTGDRQIFDFVNDIQNLIIDKELPALSQGKCKPWDGSGYDASLTIHKAQDILDFVAPGVYVADGTALKMKITPQGRLDCSLKSGRIAYDGMYAKDLSIEMDNNLRAFHGWITSSSIFLTGMELRKNQVSIFADENRLGLGYTFDNGADSDTHGELYLSARLSKGRKGVGIRAKTLPSSIYYNGDGWALQSGDVTINENGDISVDSFSARHGAEELLVDGGISSYRRDTLSLRLRDFDISILNSITSGSPSLSGYATGGATLISPTAPAPGILASLRCSSTHIDGRPMGVLNLESNWNERTQAFDFLVSNRQESINNIDLSGSFVPRTGMLEANANLKRFNLGYAEFALSSVFSEIEGALSGRIGVKGKLDNLHLSSSDLRLNDGLLALDFSRVPYLVEGDLALDDAGLHFVNVSMSDGQHGTGTIKGSVLINDLATVALGTDLHVTMNGMHALNLTRDINPSLFGNMYASGRIDVTGPLEDINVNLDLATEGEGNLHLLIGNAESASSTELLSFTEPPSTQELDPYELLTASNNKSAASQSGNLRVKLRARVFPEVSAFLELGDETTISAMGSGTIELDMEPNKGTMSLGGDYNIDQGSFHVSVMNLVTRDFAIRQGSSVRLAGDAMDTDLNVTGVYTTKASLANLIADENATNMRTVNCLINVTDKLSNPSIGFEIEIPDLSPGTQALVDGALNTEDKIQKQFVYMLLAGSFLPSEESGISTKQGSEMLLSNVSGIMAGQINNIFQKLDIPVDLGLNYKSTDTGNNLFDVALSTQLFNNRVIINGNIGNKQQYGMSTNEIAGDVDVEVKLTPSGDFRLKLFSHSADEFTSYLDNSQRNGAGFTYQRDFNSFSRFVKDIFISKAKREERSRAEALAPIEYVTVQVDTTGRAQTTE